MENTINYRNHTIKVELDQDPQTPREWDNLGTILYNPNSRYHIGDKGYYNGNAGNWRDNFAEYVMENYYPHTIKSYELYGYLRHEEVTRVWNWINDNMVVLPVRAYIHSGVTISTGSGYPYNDRFDAMQSGVIYVTKEKMLEEFGGKIFTKKLKEKAAELLEGEIKTYDSYLRGEVYGYIIENGLEDQDSCWGYFGDPEESGLISDAKSEIDAMIKRNLKKHFEKLKRWIKSRVGFEHRQSLESCFG